MEKLNEMLKRMLGNFADRNDTLKRLAALENKFKSIMEMIMAKNNPHASEEDAMFTKKPLGGISCASCERNITNL